ncbi:hypothetical protein FOWG_16883 [Fusarium oxysporum f. sp. lycopersici MN25]|nr:hypothetical protein FOWG_16883 [Fusarium oxysporum f. sp. lycopersici MN25]
MPDLYTREECIDFSQVISLSSEASPTTVSTSDVHSMGIRRLLADEELPGQSPHLEPGALPFLTSSNVSSYRDTNQGYDLPTLHEESQHSTIYKYKCEKGCGKSFKSPKDLKRHHKIRDHLDSTTKLYRCRCGFSHARKDHYCRHLAQKSCFPKLSSYICICSMAGESNSERHLQHVRACKAGKQKLGRPRK